MDETGELEGLLVVSLEQAVAAPYCGLLLADAGARVIKVERPEGDFARGYDKGANGKSTIFAWLNRGKQSIALDLKQDTDFALMRRMLAQADVFVSNLAPGTVQRMGLSGEDLRQTNPGLITARVTGYGESEAALKRKAYDFLVQAEAGLCAVTGTAEQPSRVGVSMTDLSSGLTAFSGILRALIKRQRTGRGEDIHVAMFDVVADWMNMALLAHRYSGNAPQRTGLQHSFIAPYDGFECGDGQTVMLSIQNNREWAAFARDVLEQSDLADDARFRDNTDRFENRAVLDGIIRSSFGRLTSVDVIARLDAARIANSRLNSVGEVSRHPFLTSQRAVYGGETIEVAALPIRHERGAHEAVPQLDEHGGMIRREFSGD